MEQALRQLYGLLKEFDVASLREALDGDVAAYARLVNAAARLSESRLKHLRYRDEVKERQAKARREARREAEAGLTNNGLYEIQDQLWLL